MIIFFFLADSVLTLAQSYLVGYSTVLPLIRHTCRVIIKVIQPKYMPVSGLLLSVLIIFFNFKYVARIIIFFCVFIVPIFDIFFQMPSTEREWLKISNEFAVIWNLPHVIGSGDGKHIRCRKPRNTGATYFNYKGFYSVILFAVADARYRFLFVSLGHVGRESDSTIWRNSSFKADLDDPANPLNIPAARPIPGMFFFLTCSTRN